MFDDIIEGLRPEREARREDQRAREEAIRRENARHRTFGELSDAALFLTNVTCLDMLKPGASGGYPEPVPALLQRFLTAVAAAFDRYRDEIRARLASFDWERGRAKMEEGEADYRATFDGLRRMYEAYLAGRRLSSEAAARLVYDEDMRYVPCRLSELLRGSMVNDRAVMWVTAGLPDTGPAAVPEPAIATQATPAEVTLAQLDEREQEFLQAAAALKAVDQTKRKSRDAIAQKAAPGDPPSSFYHACTRLRDRGLVETAVGPNGGVWLTPAGLRVLNSAA